MSSAELTASVWRLHFLVCAQSARLPDVLAEAMVSRSPREGWRRIVAAHGSPRVSEEPTRPQRRSLAEFKHISKRRKRHQLAPSK